MAYRWHEILIWVKEELWHYFWKALDVIVSLILNTKHTNNRWQYTKILSHILRWSTHVLTQSTHDKALKLNSLQYLWDYPCLDKMHSNNLSLTGCDVDFDKGSMSKLCKSIVSDWGMHDKGTTVFTRKYLPLIGNNSQALKSTARSTCEYSPLVSN